MEKEYKQGVLFEIEPTLLNTKFNSVDINSEDYIKSNINWQKRFSTPLFVNFEEKVLYWDFNCSYEIDYENYDYYSEAIELVAELEDLERYITSKTEIAIILDKQIIYTFEVDSIVKINYKEDVLDHLDRDFIYNGYIYFVEGDFLKRKR